MLMRARVLALVGCSAVVLGVLAPAGTAQTPGTTTLSFYEPSQGGTFKLVDIAPKSPAKNPESPKYRFSVGDQLIFSSPLLDRKGGTRQGTVWVKSTVIKGKTFPTLKLLGEGVFELSDGRQLHASGVFNLNGNLRIAVDGGTGAYAGARGELVSVNNEDDSSIDTLTLLP